MLIKLRKKIEARIGKPVDNGTLLQAIEMAKSDVVANNLVMGQDVTAQDFEDVIVRCIAVSGRCSSNGWGKEEYEAAIRNHEAALKENPEDQELLQKLQRLNLEYARYQKGVE